MKTEESMHYKLLKLSNGESIVCATDDDCQNLNSKTSIYICDPVLVTPFRMPRGMNIAETYVMTPWISISDESVFEVPTGQIIVAVDLKPTFKENYISFVESQNMPIESLKFSEKSGMLDHLLNSLGNNNEENEEIEPDRPIIVPGSKSIH